MQVRLLEARINVDLHETDVWNIMFNHDIDTLLHKGLIDGAIQEVVFLQVQDKGRTNGVQTADQAVAPRQTRRARGIVSLSLAGSDLESGIEILPGLGIQNHRTGARRPVPFEQLKEWRPAIIEAIGAVDQDGQVVLKLTHLHRLLIYEVTFFSVNNQLPPLSTFQVRG